ncbi:MAG TPA: hypothetical protein VF789_21640 [Thermoanaerobaculia bacterium]
MAAMAEPLPETARTWRFRSQEDPSAPPDPAVCAAAPFLPNLRLGATLWEEDGYGERRAGTATACARIKDPAFPPGARLPFHVVFHLPEGRVTATGEATVISNDVPVLGVILAVCHLKVVEAPAGFSGGAASSLSVFNPAGVPGIATGSEWTVRLFEN